MLTSRQVHDQLIETLDRATKRYLAVRRSARLPRNRGVRKKTKLRQETAERLAEARKSFWLAWSDLPECKDGRGWVEWLRKAGPVVEAELGPELF